MPRIDDEELEINLRGEGVHEILSFVPGKLIRYGNMVIVAIILVLLLGSWFIKYPEVLSSQASVTGANPPVQYIAQSSGRLNLFVPNNSMATKGQYLAMIENPANLTDIITLDSILKAQERALSISVDSVNLNLDRPLLLGDLQNDYTSLKQQYNNYKSFKAENYYPRKINSITGQFNYYNNLNSQLNAQQALLQRDLELARQKYAQNKSLFTSKVISQADLDRSEADYLQKEYSYKNTDINLTNNEIQLKEFEKTMLDLNQQYHETQRQYTIAFQESFKKLQSTLSAWEQRYTIKATIDGKVSLFKFFTNNQFVAAGEEILTVVPSSSKIIARCMVPLYGSGRVKTGQRVNIKLDAFPSNEFGMLEGRVESFSLTPRNNFYLVEVSLPNGLVTTYNKKLDFKNEMNGTGEIITEDLRLIERLFYQLRGIFRK